MDGCISERMYEGNECTNKDKGIIKSEPSEHLRFIYFI